ncbi:MAG: META domain-containing protein [Coriobacteriia bacterium]
MKPLARTVLLVLALSLAIPLGGCAAPNDPIADRLQGIWMLESFGTPEGLTPSDAGVPTQISMGAGKAQGSGGVNSFVAPFEAKNGGTLEFGQVQSTEMAGSPQAMEQESLFFEALENTRHFEFNGEKLIFTSSNNDTLAILVPK